MAICPKCQNILKEDFGLETCKKCGEVVFINMDDTVTLQDSYQENREEINEEVIDKISQDLETSEVVFQDTLEDSADSHESTFMNENNTGVGEFESTSENEIEGYDKDNPLKKLKHEDPFLNQPIDNDLLTSVDYESPDEVIKTTETAENTSADDFLAEMQAFGEMDSEKFLEGIYFFNIEISNIDSKETRDQIIDALDDSKLNLKKENINQKIVNGSLLLPEISAVKAYVLVQKISHLPCDISWKLIESQELSSDAE